MRFRFYGFVVVMWSVATLAQGESLPQAKTAADAQACAAFVDVEQFFEDNTADQLQESFQTISQLPPKDRLDGLVPLGVKPQTVAYFKEQAGDEWGLSVGLGLLLRHHPELVRKIQAATSGSEDVEQLDGQMNTAVTQMEELCDD